MYIYLCMRQAIIELVAIMSRQCRMEAKVTILKPCIIRGPLLMTLIDCTMTLWSTLRPYVHCSLLKQIPQQKESNVLFSFIKLFSHFALCVSLYAFVSTTDVA